ncbi:MAG: bifunctional folylpolyglutamate synthase/dihydrofolate synthase, partial [Bacteroidota bacterium]|nr:bifunctional folylpolyglutamate synthase/dihydrofolate synthase [Bacteroidota bacterium]MDX5431782.1 bifunctional folylpolyglutamate synthase/dihydrofolate synthase [Bacteroidota bacterium]MDX5470495.1 bifunctional folylpolyglutamate synthase/dihydrofolate synthase [Bacteroidota bacterium]
MRSYSETLEYLYSRLPMFTRIGGAAFKKDLSNTLALCEVLHQPQNKFKSIHIAGTNGKGSSSHMLAAIFQKAGYKTGLYTSPHLRDFRERIRINGEMISEAEVIHFTHQLEWDIERIEPSFFELTVAMAFDHFARHRVDMAIIETGMGGRLDSTNVIQPELSLITNIGFDHMEFLGDTLPLIAGEKAGIIKANTPVVISKTQDETESVFRRKAKELNAPISFADQVWKPLEWHREPEHQTFRYIRESEAEALVLRLDLMGTYQASNLPGVLETWYQLKETYSLSRNALQEGLASVQRLTGLMGRWQTLGQSPKIICDTGHNEDGIKEILSMLEKEVFSQLHLVIGMVRDKEIGKILKLLPVSAKYYFTQANIPRALPVEELMEQAKTFGLQGNPYHKVSEALEAAKQSASADDLIFIGGSTFVVA